MSAERRLPRAAFLALFVLIPLLALFASLYRQHFGFGLSAGTGDEGFYISSPVRYELGDKPFVDEHYMTATSFDLVDFVLFRLTGADTLFAIRSIGVFLSALVAAACCWSMRNRIPPLAVSLLFVALVSWAPFNLWTPNYKSLTPLLLLLSAVFFCTAAGASSQGLRTAGLAVSALSFTVAMVCYVTLVVLIPLPAVAAAVWIRANGHPANRWHPVLIWYAWLAGFLCALVAVVSAYGLAGQILFNIRERAHYPLYNTPLLARLRRKLIGHGRFRQIGATAVWVVACVACWRKSASPVLARLGYALAGIGFLTLLLTFTLRPGPPGSLELDYPTLSLWFFLANIGAIGMVLFLRIARDGVRPAFSDPGVCFLLLAVAVALVFVLSASIFSSTIAELDVCSALLWPAVLFACGRASRTVPVASPAAFLSVCLAVVFAGFSVSHAWIWNFDDQPVSHLDTSFRAARLRGIYSTAQRVRTVDTLLDDLRGRVTPGGTLLSYQWFPGLYWLTATRPFLYSSFLANNIPPDPLMSAWVSTEVRRGRAPRVIVTSEPLTGRNSVEKFILGHYRPGQTVGEFTIWNQTEPAQ